MKGAKQLDWNFTYDGLLANPYIPCLIGWAAIQFRALKKRELWNDWLVTYCMGEEL
jgi:hypothetical protein